jgi:hypothetical protein
VKRAVMREHTVPRPPTSPRTEPVGCASQRGGVRNPVQVRDGRATVTGTAVPGARNSLAANPSKAYGTHDPEEVAQVDHGPDNDHAASA